MMAFEEVRYFCTSEPCRKKSVCGFKDTDLQMKPQYLFRNFAIHRYILHCPVILYTKNECPDQIARMCRIVRDFLICKCSEGTFHMALLNLFFVKAVVSCLTHLNLASHKRDIGKQRRPRSDAAEHGV